MASVIVHHLSSRWLQCPVIYLPIVRHPINGNLILQLFLWLTFESKKETFPDSRQVNVGMRLLIDASQVHFQRILSRCKWCCVMIVHLTSFFPSKEFLLVLESFKIARMKASWKMTKIIKGSIISPLSASLGWNCVNLLVFWRRGKWLWCHQNMRHVTSGWGLSLVICLIPSLLLASAQVCCRPFAWYGWLRHDDTGSMTLRVTTCHNLSWSVTCYKYDGLLMWPIIMCRNIIIPCENVISSCRMRGLYDPFYEWYQIRDWMKIMKVMRLWDAYHHDLIGLQSANQSPELWSSDHWQICIVCAHHNQWQDKMIQISSSIEWNCVSFKIL